jgi:hypothetical protein
MDDISPELSKWIERQRIFFVATAPLAGDGLINCSPKGMDTFRILGPRDVAYLDLTGSGVETIAHSRENGRIVFTGGARLYWPTRRSSRLSRHSFARILANARSSVRA